MFLIFIIDYLDGIFIVNIILMLGALKQKVNSCMIFSNGLLSFDDDNQEVATRMDVKAMPTFLLLKDGAAVEKVVGANPEELKKRIDVFVQSIHVSLA